MQSTQIGQDVELTPGRVIQLLRVKRRTWIVPTAIFAVMSMLYALLMTRYWEASQGLVVRDEASMTSSNQPGKFADLYQMRTFQETILELAKSHHVVTQTIKNVAEKETGKPATEPDAEQIEKFRKRLSMSPANGAEFGKTEVFYFSVKDPSRERAIRLVAELCEQLSARLGKLRTEQSQGLVNEFEKQVEVATKVHQTENTNLKEFESQIGADLGELRLLHSATGGQSDLRQQLVELEKEARTTNARLREAEDLLIVLHAAEDDPQQLIAMPSSLLKIQPTLQRLKDGLVDAQLQASKLIGTRTEQHPQVKAALDTVEQIREELHHELAVVIEGLEVEIGLSHNRLEVLNSQLAELQGRLNRLAKHRAEYSSRVASVENSRTLLSQARKQLSEARAKQVVASSAQLVTPIDVPETGPHPVGLGRSKVVLLGTFGGLVLGLGWLFLNLPAASKTAPDVIGPVPQPAARQWQPVASPPTAYDVGAYTKKPGDLLSPKPNAVSAKPLTATAPAVAVPPTTVSSVAPPSLAP